ncbi:MAG: type IV secretory system conjugative DNA transfer family protein [Pyrinomonadaceae bacterium]
MTDYLTTQNERYAAALAEAFSVWEKRLRGWEVWDYAVNLEPPPGSIVVNLTPILPIQDDARLQSGFQKLFGRNQNPNTPLIGNIQPPSETTGTHKTDVKPPAFYRSEEITELQILLSQDLEISPALMEQFWLSLTSCPTPIGFEFIADEAQIIVQIACDTSYALHLINQLKTFFPGLYLNEQKEFLTSYFDNRQALAIADFGLSRNFLLPLQMFRSFNPDPLTGLISSLGNLQTGEKALFQILFQPTRLAWTEELQKLQANPNFRKSFQEKNPAILSSLREKLSAPLFAVVIRLAAQSASRQQSWEILKRIGGSFIQFANPNNNELFALSNDNYSENNHLMAILNRTSYRSGMILNAAELAAFAHLPSNSVNVEKLKRDERKTKAAPPLALGHRLILGENPHNGQSRPASLSNEQRTRHLHIIGSSGSGKSMLLLKLIKQDLEQNQGLCVIDPHGDLIDEAIANVPESRLGDIILFDPSDAQFPIGFNILQAKSELEKTLLSSDLIATFRRMSTSWGDVMDSVLANAILAFVESSRGGTLFELKRFLVEKDFRNEFLKTVQDEAVRYFWINEFPLITGKPQSSILIRLDGFLRQKLIRNIVCQKENKLNFREIMDSRKVLLIKLSQGAIGEENAHLLGTLLVSKLYQTALSRQDTNNRPFFSCYLDEFHHFITPSMESVLSGVRKYNLGLVLAHQEFRQLNSRSLEVASSVLSNCYTRICFRLGDTDAERFASGFSFFDAKALQNLGIGEAIARIERSEYDFNFRTILLPKVEKSVAEHRRLKVIRHSRGSYGMLKNEVEASLFAMPEKLVTADIPPDETTKTAFQETKVQKPKVEAEKQPIDSTSEVNHQHRYLQSIIKRIGENYGFVATIEKQVFGGIGKIDVALENESCRIACEIAVTNTSQYELQNIQKCLASGFDKVVVVSSDSKHLGNIRKTAESVISDSELAKVHFLEPENFHLFLDSLKKQITNPIIKKTKVKGYQVNADFKDVSDTEAATRKQTVFDIIKGVVKRKGNK